MSTPSLLRLRKETPQYKTATALKTDVFKAVLALDSASTPSVFFMLQLKYAIDIAAKGYLIGQQIAADVGCIATHLNYHFEWYCL
jgi:hypothetical protein